MKKTKSMPKGGWGKKRSDCPISNVLDLLGDKWTLILIRDMLMFQKTFYKEFATSPEGIPTNILADRLRRLECAGILSKEAYQDNPTRYAYRLTRKGLDLFSVLQAMGLWGVKHLEGIPKRDPAFLKKLQNRIRLMKRAAS